MPRCSVDRGWPVEMCQTCGLLMRAAVVAHFPLDMVYLRLMSHMCVCESIRCERLDRSVYAFEHASWVDEACRKESPRCLGRRSLTWLRIPQGFVRVMWWTCIFAAIHCSGTMSRALSAEGCQPHREALAFSRPSLVLDGSDWNSVERLWHTLKFFLRTQIDQWFRHRLQEPIAEVYSSDATPLVCCERYTQKYEDFLVRRRGKSSGDWLIERYFVLDTKGSAKVWFSEPRPLGDKTAWAHYQAQVAAMPLARQRGHTGIVVSHHIWDRAVASACERHQRQRHAAYQMSIETQCSEGEAVLTELLSWFTSVGCCAHDTHNALKWSIFAYTHDREVMRDTWVVLESLQSSFDLLVAHMGDWIVLHVAYKDHPDPEVLRRFWLLMGLSHDTVELLTKAQLRWQDGCLFVAHHLKDDADLPALISACLMAVWSFKSFSDSRWCGLGSGCRSLISSLALGLRSLVDAILDDSGCSKYYISGFQRLTGKALHMAGLVACSAHVTDSALAKILEDDRMPVQAKNVFDDMVAEVEYITTLTDEVLQLACESVGAPARALRDELIQCAAVQAGFFRMRLRPAFEPPWDLCSGDVRANLAKLASGDCPHELVSSKIWRLLRMGFPAEELELGVRLMGQLGWSTKVVEQGHAAASVVMKCHRQYGSHTMQGRSFLVQARPLLQGDVEDKVIGQLRERIHKLERLQPQRVGGRHMYMKSLREQAATMQAAGRQWDHDIGKVIMKGHGAKWKALTAQQRQRFERSATDFKEKRRQEIADQVQELRSELALRKERRKQEVATQNPLAMTACRLSESERTDFDALCRAPEWTGSHLAELTSAAAQKIYPPTPEVQEVLQAMPIEQPVQSVDAPEWISFICRQREFFNDCIIRSSGGQGDRFFRFVFAMKNPLLLCMCKVVPVEESTDMFTPKDFDKQALDTWRMQFTWDWSGFLYSDSGAFDDCGDIHVLPCVVNLSAGAIGADGDWVSLEALRLLLPTPKPSPSKPSVGPKATTQEVPESLAMHPNFWDVVADAGGSQARVVEPESSKAAFKSEASDSSSGDEVDEIAAMEELWEKRQELSVMQPLADETFAVSLRGGAWTASKKGIAYDCFLAAAKRSEIKSWCRDYKTPASGSFSIAKYGMSLAQGLADAWAWRHAFLYQLWLDRGADSSYVFSPADYESIPDSDGCRAVEASGHRVALERLRQLRSTRVG